MALSHSIKENWRKVPLRESVSILSFSSPYFPAFGPEIFRIRTLFTQWSPASSIRISEAFLLSGWSTRGLTHSWPMFLFYIPWFSGVLRGYKIEALAKNGSKFVNEFLLATERQRMGGNIFWSWRLFTMDHCEKYCNFA